MIDSLETRLNTVSVESYVLSLYYNKYRLGRTIDIKNEKTVVF